MQNIDLTQLLQAVIALAAAIITGMLIPWIKAHTTNQQQILLQATVEILVSAAEQMYGASKGPEKLEYVKAELEKRGFTVDVATIESAVRAYTHTKNSVA